MFKNYFYLIVIGVSFLVLSALVYITRGKNSYFIRKKFKLGSAIILLTVSLGLIPGCFQGVDANCYTGPGTSVYLLSCNSENICENVYGEISVNLAENNSLLGQISYGFSEVHTFYIYSKDDPDRTILQSGTLDLEVLGGENNHIQEFTINLDSSLTAGTYILEIKRVRYDDEEWTIEEIVINIIA